jgi:hypothetical protein
MEQRRGMLRNGLAAVLNLLGVGMAPLPFKAAPAARSYANGARHERRTTGITARCDRRAALTVELQ